MGFYDRDYNRGDYDRAPGYHLGSSLSLTTKLVFIMFGVYLVQVLTPPNPRNMLASQGWFTDLFTLYPDVLKHPLYLFQLLTYGFLHSPNDATHIIYNMFGFWFFGRDVEYRYGRREYLAFFLVAIVAAGLVWVLGEFAANHGFTHLPGMYGASGAVSAIVVLFALNFPHRIIYLMLFLPAPAWLLALIYVGFDILGAIQRIDNIAYTAHLGGALFAFIYYKAHWRLQGILPTQQFWKRWKPWRPKPRLRVHHEDDSDPAEPSFEAQVDTVLKKIQDHGRESLTRSELRLLQKASEEFQKQRGKK